MNITVFGASGKVGRLLCTELLRRGHSITAFVHNNAGILTASEQLKIVAGDVHTPNDVLPVLSGCDVVVSCLGSWGTKSKDIVGTATAVIIPAMQQNGIKRFVSVTGSAAMVPGQKLSLVDSLTRTLLGLIAKPILVDGEKHLQLLSKSSLDWTAIRSPAMSSGTSTGYMLSTKSPALWVRVSRASVVCALADVIEQGSFVGEAPFIAPQKS